MSILDSCKGGTLLEKPIELERNDNRGSATDLLARVRADLLPAQRDFIDDNEHRIVGYIGGFGSGKSFALAAKAITLGLLNPGTTAMVAEPSFAVPMPEPLHHDESLADEDPGRGITPDLPQYAHSHNHCAPVGEMLIRLCDDEMTTRELLEFECRIAHLGEKFASFSRLAQVTLVI